MIDTTAPEAGPLPSPAASFDGGSLDCGSGLLLLIRRHIDPLDPGALLEIRSTESSVEEDLPAWCRLTGNDLVAVRRDGPQRRFLVRKAGAARAPGIAPAGAVGTSVTVPTRPENSTRRQREPAPLPRSVVEVCIPDRLPPPRRAPTLPPLATGGIGSWPRPGWMLRALHEHLEGRMAEEEFQRTADDAVRLAVASQQRAGVDILTDGEQRRDNYASFVGGLLDNCQLIPITDLLPYVEDPEEFARELRALDVPASEVRHPAVFGRLGRRRPLAVHEYEFVQRIAPGAATKVALPGPYLLARTMWMECISDRAYSTREELAADIVRVLREEVAFLLAAGASVVQFDEPVLSEVVHGRSGSGGRSFMCGALGEKKPVAEELAFARELLHAVLAGFPEARTAVHVCRGNWTPDESAALSGDYRPLLALLASLPAGILFLEACTPRAGELEVLASLPDRQRLGIGVLNQKDACVEDVEEVIRRAERAIALFGASRVLLNTDCGFATFADNPIAAAAAAEAKLTVLAQAATRLRERHRLS